MSTMIREVYDAFKAAGVDEEKAAAAAEALSRYELDKEQLATQQDVQGVKQGIVDVRQDLTQLEGDVKLLRWMVGFNLAISAAVLWLLIRMGMSG